MAVYNANNGCQFEGRNIFFDTNVYIFVDGNDSRPVSKIYSNYYWEIVRSKNNTIIMNDYIISEFFNRCCKDQYKLELDNELTNLPYKQWRKLPDSIEILETIRDSILHFLGDAQFVQACSTDTKINDILHEAAKGSLDFSDLMINAQCQTNKYILVTDDADYIDCNIDIVTANPKILYEAAQRGILM